MSKTTEPKHYNFKVFLNGIGKTKQEAWEDMLEGILDAFPELLPEDIEVTEEGKTA